MPKPPKLEVSKSATVYLGIDPGVNGGLAAIFNGNVEAIPMPETERDLFEWLSQWYSIDTVAVVEEQWPRPTFFGGKNSILKSTCLLYGHYTLIRGMLTALKVKFEEQRPQEWLKGLSIPSGKKREVESKDWKKHLRGKAQQLFPDLPVWEEKRALGRQLAISDALLIAEWCRRKHGNK